MDGATLRKANEADAAALGALHVASWHETYTGILPKDLLAGLSSEARGAMWRDILLQPDTFGCIGVLVAEHAGSMIGFGACGRQRDQTLDAAKFTGEFSAIYVLRSHQGRGIGRAIMAAMAAALLAAGHSAASLWVLRQNDRARRFYAGLDGIVVGERKDEQPNVTLTEDAYGWRDLMSLVG